MKIVADKKIPYIDSAFGNFGTLIKVESGAINRAMVRDADALIVRSETKVDENLLSESNVSFVGSATIGTDHVDLKFLANRGIRFANAPGCNANAVAQYILSALLTIAQRQGFSLKNKTLGVVGIGNVGSKVVRIAKAMGMNVLECDPPLSRSTGDPRFLALNDLMDADIISLHVPLTKEGRDPTFHLFDEEGISKMKTGAILINSSRGAVVKTEALKSALANRKLSAAVLDVWEREPNIDIELLSLCEIGTPHIAGYSFDGKVNATKMVYQAFCEHFKFPQMWDADELKMQVRNPVIVADEAPFNEQTLTNIVKQCYDIEKDDESLRAINSCPSGRARQVFQTAARRLQSQA